MSSIVLTLMWAAASQQFSFDSYACTMEFSEFDSIIC